MNYLRKYPLTILCVVAVWVLCLVKPPSIGLDNIKNIDKLYHVVMYWGMCLVLWWEYWCHHQHLAVGRIVLLAVLLPIAMSGVIELLQEYCTANRSGDWMDLLANAIGVVSAAVLGRWVLPRIRSRFRKK